MNDNNSEYTRWNCKYHLVFIPKYRKQVLKQVVGEILRQLCVRKSVDIVEAEICPDHIHMLPEIPQDERIKLYGLSERAA